jgi:hypothetical protein
MFKWTQISSNKWRLNSSSSQSSANSFTMAFSDDMYRPPNAVSGTGRTISFRNLFAVCEEVLDRELWNIHMYRRVCNWLNSYQDGGPLPGFQKFFSPLSGTYVQFPTLLDHLITLDDEWSREADRIMNESLHSLSDNPEDYSDDEDAHYEFGLFYELDMNLGD